MTHVIFDLCIRDGACAEVCPVECIVPGQPEEEWPWYYIDPDTCIDCGACVLSARWTLSVPKDLEPQYFASTEINARYFSEGPGYP
ncbi:MAG: ferredoxin family protein [Anaerolineae bacterium]|nr:MAG: ferredoxin family protein [Anaerolineae bacterium]